MNEIKKNEVYTVTIEGYSSEGLGIARLDGRVLFVHGGVRGETCDVLVLKVLKNVAFAKVKAVQEPSPHRVEPACPHFRKCGGCNFWHIDYEEELAAKQQKVRDALERLGGQQVADLPIFGSMDTEHYRNKVQFPVSAPDRIGFYRARTHEVIPVEHCRIQSAAAEKIAAAVGAWMQEAHIPAYDEREHTGWLRHIYVRTAKNGDALVCLVARTEEVGAAEALVAHIRAAWPQTVGVLVNRNDRRGNAILGDTYCTLWGQDFLMDVLCGKTFKLSVPSFYQVNRAQAERLYALAVDFAGLQGTETVLDLYCGTGTITLTLADHAARVIGAEIVPEAIADAKENAARNGVENAEFFCGDASAAAAKFAQEGLSPEVVVVDPPRKGLAEDVIDAVAKMAPQRVVYVSCDPATLGRDVKRFAEQGYTLQKAAAVDMFPKTHHVETVVLLSRGIYPQSIEVKIDVSDGEVTQQPTYKRIQEYVEQQYGFKVHTAYIAEVKRMCGLDMHKAPNAVEQRKHQYHPCPPEKVEAIKDALRHFGMI